MDTIKSEKIVQAYIKRETKLERMTAEFSGIWETTLDEFFPLLCPAREADWIPGWDCEVLYSNAEGYASEKCIFKTEKSNPAGEGLWTFTGYKKNSFVEFVRFQPDMLLHVRITTNDNNDGTVMGTWNVTATALTEKGNKEIDKMRKRVNQEAKVLPKVVGHYLKTGKVIKKTSLLLGIAHDAIRGH